ncbi:MAG: M14 family metallopeptidase, partial [Planctomycetes bacterium]|nr:M14 family metallopeptidase [Planctomycetota bacterium]
LLRTRTFYILPSQNPDGRDDWFNTAGTAHSSRTGNTPFDNDRDGVADEDDTDDLDGDGEILSMRKRVPLGEGTHTIDPDDERIMVPARPGHPGDWVLLGLEGIDNDGDGRINEDGLGGYDMNRNWPSDWQPNHIQRGAGDYPFCYPETAAVGEFMLSKQNIAAVQSFHNSGGMILMGPGADYVKYPRADVAVYDTLGKEGEDILPFYRLMIVWKDLYTVHGGFVTWAYEGLGAFSFTNELWATPQYYGGDRDNEKGWFAQNRRDQLDFNDSVMLGEVWVDWHEVDHPLYGTVEVGGFKRQHGRVAPSFMIEEMIHRNAIFCARHAEEIAEPEFTRVEIEPLGDSLWRVTAVLQNERAMPTRSALAAQKGLGTPDRALVQGPSVRVLAGGVQTDAWRTESMQAVEREPHRLLLEAGVPAEGSLTLQWIVQGSGDLQLEYQADRAMNATWSGTLGDISE